ncbi:MAG: hypothetical protein MHMPM18_004803 [Marteilia pararefringens]
MCLVISDMATLATHSKTSAAVKYNKNLRKLYKGQVVCIRDIIDINNVIVVAYGADGKKIIDPIKICLRHLQPLKICLPNITRESKLSEFQTEMGSEKLHSIIKDIPAVQKTTLKLKVTQILLFFTSQHNHLFIMYLGYLRANISYSLLGADFYNSLCSNQILLFQGDYCKLSISIEYCTFFILIKFLKSSVTTIHS